MCGGDPHEVWYRFAGKQIGYVGNNGTLDTGYVPSVQTRTATVGTGAFRNGAAAGPLYADFDQSLPQINSYFQGGVAGGYTVQAGETLRSIAARLYGDASLWWKIAEANGLSGEAALIEGQSLILPAGALKNTHNASTFTPYDPADIIGDTSPTAPRSTDGRETGPSIGAVLMEPHGKTAQAVAHACLAYARRNVPPQRPDRRCRASGY